MVIRYYWGAGVGHVYSHKDEGPATVVSTALHEDEDQGDSLNDNEMGGTAGEMQNEDESGDEDNMQQDAEEEHSDEGLDDIEDDELLSMFEMYGES